VTGEEAATPLGLFLSGLLAVLVVGGTVMVAAVLWELVLRLSAPAARRRRAARRNARRARVAPGPLDVPRHRERPERTRHAEPGT
jgi:hypothetical protein